MAQMAIGRRFKVSGCGFDCLNLLSSSLDFYELLLVFFVGKVCSQSQANKRYGSFPKPVAVFGESCLEEWVIVGPLSWKPPIYSSKIGVARATKENVPISMPLGQHRV